jgi:hypothetical protein
MIAIPLWQWRQILTDAVIESISNGIRKEPPFWWFMKFMLRLLVIKPKSTPLFTGGRKPLRDDTPLLIMNCQQLREVLNAR